MAHVIPTRGLMGRVQAAPRSNRLLARVRPVVQAPAVKWIIRYTFYMFIFSLPFEEAYLAGGTTMSKLLGLALAAVALLQPHVCYKSPPKAFRWFVIYLAIYGLWAAYLLLVPPNIPDFSSLVVGSVFRLVQFLTLFWLSYNLMKQERVVNGAFWALSAATILLSVLQILGVTSEASKDPSRMTAFEGNPNSLATVLSLGLLALFGLAYGRTKNDWKARWLFWLGAGILALAVIQTGSRGPVVAVLASLAVFFLRGKNLATKLKYAVIASVGVVFLFLASYRNEAVRVRWEKTFYDDSLAGREKIYPAAIRMILESPLIGWGPINHFWELGPRVGKPFRDEHNVYLWILAEVGLVGAIPFFIGLWLCWRSAWSARSSVQGILPAILLLFILAGSMSETGHNRKYYWVILAQALAAGSYRVRPQRPKTIVPPYTRTRSRFSAIPGTMQPRRVLRS
jgi:O-antigen ligase